jgi:hypothetical protein
MILNDVIEALVTSFTAATDPTPVYDSIPDLSKRAFVVVAADGEDNEGADVDFALSDLGPGTWLTEQGEITCSTWAQVGTTDIAGRRQAAADLAEQCVAAVRADRTLSGLLTGPGIATVSELRYSGFRTEHGTFCRFTFIVSYQHLLAS